MKVPLREKNHEKHRKSMKKAAQDAPGNSLHRCADIVFAFHGFRQLRGKSCCVFDAYVSPDFGRLVGVVYTREAKFAVSLEAPREHAFRKK